ncbi:MAG: hypothetical protein AB1306_06150 [Nitrospirota bacterium]
MTDHNIKPERITKPIQLLGAWLAGLFSIDSCFLFAAANMAAGSWESMALVIAAILNVPVFLIAVFLLQTKFRPELQEDSYYSSYLSQKTNEPITINRSEAHLMEIGRRLEFIEKGLINAPQSTKSSATRVSRLIIGINKHLSDKDTIKSKLADVGVLGTSSFGSTDAPDYRNVSISQYLPTETVAEIVTLARECGFDHYNFFDNGAEETSEDVLFGSYGKPEFEIARKTS